MVRLSIAEIRNDLRDIHLIRSVQMLQVLVVGLQLTKEDLLGIIWEDMHFGMSRYLFEEMNFTKEELRLQMPIIRDMSLLQELLDIGFTIPELREMIGLVNDADALRRLFDVGFTLQDFEGILPEDPNHIIYLYLERMALRRGYTRSDLVNFLPIEVIKRFARRRGLLPYVVASVELGGYTDDEIVRLLPPHGNTPMDTIKYMVSRGVPYIKIERLLPDTITDIDTWGFLLRNLDMTKQQIRSRLPANISPELKKILVDYGNFTEREIRALQIAGRV